MAIFSITSAKFWDDAAFSTRAGNDTYTIDGGSLTIDTDTRYCANSSAATGVLGNVTISASLGGSVLIDGTKVRLIPYNSGSGTVPAIGTSIVQGGVSGPLLGVWSAINAAPSAVGAAMPASGYLKIRAVTGGAYTAGALTGIGASATGADIVGWIEIIGAENKALTVSRRGSFTANGAWFDLGVTSGAANQTVQLPKSLGSTVYPGIYVETAPSSGVYEFWPSIYSIIRSTTPTDKRGKVCWIDGSSFCRIGNNGAHTVGFVPVAGCKIRVGNVIFINAAAANLSVNAWPNATLLNRYTFSTAGQGALTFNKCNMAWYPGFATPYSLTMTDSAWLDQLYVSTSFSPNMTFTRCGNGITGIANFGFRLAYCLAGATVTDCAFYGATSSSAAIDIQSCENLAISGTKGALVVPRASAGVCPWNIGANKSTFTDNVYCGGAVRPVGNNLSFINSHYVDNFEGTTNQSSPTRAMYVTGCNYLTFDGFDFWGLTNVHPAYYPFSINSCADVKIRNIGSYASPLNCGTLNPCSIFIEYSNTVNLVIQRCYTTNISYKFIYGATTDYGLVVENSGEVSYARSTINEFGQNVQIKGLISDLSYSGTGTPGYCFGDCFVSATQGRFNWLLNEQTSHALSAGSYVTTGTASFTGGGVLIMPAVNDSIEWTTPYWVLGHTGFANTTPYFGGQNASNFTRTYAIDKNDGNGFGSYKTVSAANLSAETGIDASKGFKLKVKIVTTSANADQLSQMAIYTNTTATAQGYQYPLDQTDFTFTVKNPSGVLVTGFEWRLYLKDAAEGVIGTTELDGSEYLAAASYTYRHEYSSDTPVILQIIKEGYEEGVFEFKLNSTPADQVVTIQTEYNI